jgi:hypothetical protein
MGGGHDSGLTVIGGDLATARRFLGCRSIDLIKRVSAAAPLGDGFRSWLPIQDELEVLVNTPEDRLATDRTGEENAARIIAMGELFAFSRTELSVRTTGAENLIEGEHFLWHFIDGTDEPSPFPKCNNDENVWVQIILRSSVSSWLRCLDNDISAAAKVSEQQSQVDDAQALRSLVAELQASACDVVILHDCPT